MVKKGFCIELDPKEVSYLWFKKKICPKCGSKMKEHKECEIVTGADVNSPTDHMFARDAEVKRYTYKFICEKCGSQFTLSELANWNRHKSK